MVRLTCLLGVALLSINMFAKEKNPSSESSALKYQMKSLSGEPVDLRDYKGKVLLLVNTASKCGLTPQYADLQKLHEKYKDQGLVVIGFPCNQFGKQEPGDAKEISTFCTQNYGVTFDMFEKVEVNGDDACDLYKQLTSLDLKPKGSGKISWNFEKFLIDREGKPVARFEPRTAPHDEALVATVEKLLAAE